MRFMELPKHKSGYCWENIAPLGSDPEWKEVVTQKNYGGEDGKIFGIRSDIFLAKQYKG